MYIFILKKNHFKFAECLSVFPGYPAIITCPESSVIDTYAIQYDTMSNRCPALISFSRNQINRITVCKNLSTCSIQTDRHNLGRANIYYQCKGLYIVKIIYQQNNLMCRYFCKKCTAFFEIGHNMDTSLSIRVNMIRPIFGPSKEKVSSIC